MCSLQILTPKPMPPPAACNMEEIDKTDYDRVAARVASDRANPPDYNLRFRNCKNWADGIKDLLKTN